MKSVCRETLWKKWNPVWLSPVKVKKVRRARAYVTKVGACPKSDTFFPNLDESPDWQLTQVLQEGQEEGICYQMCVYERKA